MASTIKVNTLDTQAGTDIALAVGKNITGANTQFKITGGASGNVLSTDGSGALTWGAPSIAKISNLIQPTAITSATATTTSTTFVDITGLTVDITPSAATSKVLIFYSATIGSNAGWHAHLRLMRDTTPIAVGDANGSRKQSTTESGYQAAIANTSCMMYLDSPATTSTTTYKLQWASESSGTIYLNRSYTNTDNANFGTFVSTITVMEITA